ncbi:retrotransposon protein [Striga asiatica]|uniref:Retrotransposon protein n=1 Tax=Striga asiatica TaxID=4170 RepID=A0A5A7PKN4_STRAF|nr:retrotransposon protein [Striga asiatica]
MGYQFVEEKLDRFFISFGWLSQHPLTSSSNIGRSSSEHNLILLTESPSTPHPQKRFHLDRRWIGKEGIHEVISKAWNTQHFGTPIFQVQSKIKETRISLLKWSRNFRTGLNNVKVSTTQLEQHTL